MRITKFAHACLLVEEGDASILIDPGSWNALPKVARLDAILITHEHQDHCSLEQVRALRAAHPDMIVITHDAVGTLLRKAGIPYRAIEPGGIETVGGVRIESFGTEHAIIYGDTSPCRNTGFRIADMLFVPGDALHDVPEAPVAVLALPTAGPWMKLAEAIDYAKRVKPRVVFPIHDALYTEDVRTGMVPRIVGGTLESAGIAFRQMGNGAVEEF